MLISGTYWGGKRKTLQELKDEAAKKKAKETFKRLRAKRKKKKKNK